MQQARLQPEPEPESEVEDLRYFSPGPATVATGGSCGGGSGCVR